jgi:hypothetical protein
LSIIFIVLLVGGFYVVKKMSLRVVSKSDDIIE